MAAVRYPELSSHPLCVARWLGSALILWSCQFELAQACEDFLTQMVFSALCPLLAVLHACVLLTRV